MEAGTVSDLPKVTSLLSFQCFSSAASNPWVSTLHRPPAAPLKVRKPPQGSRLRLYELAAGTGGGGPGSLPGRGCSLTREEVAEVSPSWIESRLRHATFGRFIDLSESSFLLLSVESIATPVLGGREEAPWVAAVRWGMG